MVHEKAGPVINKFVGLILFFLDVFTCMWVYIKIEEITARKNSIFLFIY